MSLGLAIYLKRREKAKFGLVGTRGLNNTQFFRTLRFLKISEKDKDEIDAMSQQKFRYLEEPL